MDLTFLTRGRHKLSSLTPMEYCWVASNFASALHRDPHFVPSDHEIMSMLFSGYIDRFPYQIDYSALIISCLIFHGDRLLVCYPRTEINGRGITHFTTTGGEPTTRRGLQPKCCVPTFVTSRTHSSFGFDAENPGRQIPSPIELVLHEWAERITNMADRVDSCSPGVIYKTIPDDGKAFARPADEHVLGIVAGMFHCDHGQEPKTDSSTAGDELQFDAIRFDGTGDSGLTGEWFTESQVASTPWHSQIVKDLALAAFKVRRRVDVAADGFQAGQMT